LKVSIHQSQYLPWPPYFRIVACSDAFVLMDDVQYQKNGVQNRNRVRGAADAFWLTVPVTGHLADHIRDKKLADDRWRAKHWQSIRSAYGGAPQWAKHAAALEAIYAQPAATLGEINDRVLEFFLAALGIGTRVLRMSEMGATGAKSELVLELCRRAGAATYLSGTGAKDYLDEAAFARAGIALEYLPSAPPQYPQFQGGAFIAGLSMLDMLMNVEAAAIRDYLMAPA
jgi:hypothetical protein